MWLMPLCTIRSGFSCVMSLPQNVTLPPAFAASPDTAFSSDVLPAPLLPIRVTISPFETSSDTPRSAVICP